MCEKIRWGVYGLMIGIGVSAVVVSTNKKVQRTIYNGTEKVVDKFNEMKDTASEKINCMKNNHPKPKSVTKSTQKNTTSK